MDPFSVVMGRRGRSGLEIRFSKFPERRGGNGISVVSAMGIHHTSCHVVRTEYIPFRIPVVPLLRLPGRSFVAGPHTKWPHFPEYCVS